LIFRSESLAFFLFAAPLLGVGVGAVTPVTNALIADLASAPPWVCLEPSGTSAKQPAR
jgi:hypothetical protein